MGGPLLRADVRGCAGEKNTGLVGVFVDDVSTGATPTKSTGGRKCLVAARRLGFGSRAEGLTKSLRRSAMGGTVRGSCPNTCFFIDDAGDVLPRDSFGSTGLTGCCLSGL